jgi:hypothetical protein
VSLLSSPNPLSAIATQNAPNGNIWTLKVSYVVASGSTFTIPSGSSLVILPGSSFTVSTYSSLTNNGIIYNAGGSIILLPTQYTETSGQLFNNGTIYNYSGGIISFPPKSPIHNQGTIYNGSSECGLGTLSMGGLVFGNPVQPGCPALGTVSVK